MQLTNSAKRIILVLLLSIILVKAIAQHSLPDTIRAIIVDKINFDGKLTEPVWATAPAINNFIQRELEFGKPATEQTNIAIVYDNLALYIGIWCYQKKETIVAKFMQRDFDFDTEDNFEVIISPFNDKRNGYLFVINPNGARADALVSGQESSNINWNGVWDAKTNITNEGWFAEIRIPFNSLQFKRETIHSWAINFERNIRSKNEQVLWQGWSRDYELENIAQAGTLAGLANIGYAKRFELKPYGLAGFEKRKGDKANYPGKAGADLNVSLTPTLKLNLTTNTDFAQVEADRIAVNLSRFNLFYPEKREFFLEGYQNYQFNLGGSNEIFYTRKIGIENFEPVSIIAGGRLFGKVGRNNIGLLNLQTASAGNVPSTNNSIIRYKRDIGNQSYIGGILTSKNNNNVSNQVVGLDGAYNTSKFLKNKNLVIGGLISKSFDKGKSSSNAYAWNLFIDYPNDLIDNFIGIRSIQQDYNPELGFLERTNFDNLRWFFRFTPRWFTKYGIRKMYFRPWGFELYRTHTTGELESFHNETRPLGFFTKSGERFEYNLIQQFDRLDDTFTLTDAVKIPQGKYWMYRQEIQAGTFQGRRIWVDVEYGWGGFYTGRISVLETSVGINVNKHLNFRTDYALNKVKLPQGNVITNEFAQYVNYAFNPRFDIAAFVQSNSLDDLLLGNFRLHWIPNIGSDLYVVYNRGYENLKQFSFMRPRTSDGAMKLVWRFTF
ncbi:MAG TPA: DUF5916 domain-containing protein [Panacibacter sp.]|nr:DUF5916 domain-containing protein [Panacibacter sp.]